MSLALMAVEGVALACAGLALALPAYVFAVVIWSATRTAVADLAHAGEDGLAALARRRDRRVRAMGRGEGTLGVAPVSQGLTSLG